MPATLAMMPETHRFIDQEKFLRARLMTPEKRFEEAMELVDLAYEVMESGVRTEHPDASADEVRLLLRKKLARLRRMSDHGIFDPLRPSV